MHKSAFNTFPSIQSAIVRCRKCPRLVQWREEVARIRKKRFLDESYWGKPVPGFGDIGAKVLIVGLAPAAHGANRTGRMFTGDESGRWLYRALFKVGWSNKPDSAGREDNLVLNNCYITAACRCAPPQNKPLPEELRNCQPFILRELALLSQLRVIIGLGRIGFNSVFDRVRTLNRTTTPGKPKFSHGAIIPLNESLTLIGCYHPSQQNTFTGRLTEPMFDRIFRIADSLLK